MAWLINRLGKRGRLLSRRLVLAVTAAAFTVLVLVTAHHLHVGPDQDEACAVCTVFAEKLHHSPPSAGLVRPAVAVHLVVASRRYPQLIGITPIPLPPNCGPPEIA
jgi:hypothetical protein